MTDDDLRRRAHRAIPGGAHTYAKGDDQFPVDHPGFLVRGEGAWAYDADGNGWVEYNQGLRSVLLGHGHPAVVEAVQRAVSTGTNFIRPHPIEVEAAERLLAFIGQPDWQVKFGKHGSDGTTAAVRLARAATGRDGVAICRDHPFFSVDDWFIGSTDMSAGIPSSARALTHTFPYGDLAALDDLLDDHGSNLACVLLEAAKYDDPPDGYLAALIDRCHRHGVLVVLDEMITGFRWPGGSAMRHYGVTPDLAAFGKAMGNGVSVSALAGRRDLMELGGLRTSHERVFLLSLTHGAETIGLAAALAVLDVLESEPVLEHLQRVGTEMREAIREVAAAHDLADHLEVSALPQTLVWTARDADGEPSQALRTLVLQELAANRVLAPSLVLGYAHGQQELEITVDAFRAAAPVLRRALEQGSTDGLLRGRPSAPAIRRFVGAEWMQELT